MDQGFYMTFIFSPWNGCTTIPVMTDRRICDALDCYVCFAALDLFNRECNGCQLVLAISVYDTRTASRILEGKIGDQLNGSAAGCG